MKTLTLLPIGGLCNRMRSIVSAKLVTEHTNHRLRVLWVKNQGLSARYSDLFEKDKSCDYLEINDLSSNLLAKLYSGILTGRNTSAIIKKMHTHQYDVLYNQLKTDELKREEIKRLTHCKKIFISSFTSFFDPENKDYSCFTPVAEINNRINEFSYKFSSQTYGLHIRRTDNRKSISFSPVSAFKQIICNHLKKEPTAIFFLASDSTDVKLELLNLFPGKIITQQIQPSRSSLTGMFDAVTDLFLLSKCAMVYGSYYSSFSHTAADIGKIQEVTVMKDSQL